MAGQAGNSESEWKALKKAAINRVMISWYTLKVCSPIQKSSAARFLITSAPMKISKRQYYINSNGRV